MRYYLMSTAELRAVARRDGIEDYSRMSKFELTKELERLTYSGHHDILTLRKLARLRGISGYSEMSKVELIHQLNTVIRYIYQPTLGSVPRNVKVVHFCK